MHPHRRALGFPSSWIDNPTIRGSGQYGVLTAKFNMTSHPGSGVVEEFQLFPNPMQRDQYVKDFHKRTRSYRKDVHIDVFTLTRSYDPKEEHVQQRYSA